MAEDEVRSTTPPLPPPESSETQPQQPVRDRSQDRPTSPRREAQADPVETQSHKMESDRQSKLPRPAHSSTPEPIRVPQSNHQANGHNRGQTASLTHAAHLAAEEQSSSPGTPGHLTPFDWDDLDARFDKALADANAHEADLVAEFASLVKVGWTEAASCKTGLNHSADTGSQYFNIWASTASAHDNERATKRLQTRSHFVKLREADLDSKRQNCESAIHRPFSLGRSSVADVPDNRRTDCTGLPERHALTQSGADVI